MIDVNLKYKVAGSMKVTPSAKLIYSLLIDNNITNKEIEISINEISKNLKISRKTVSKSLHRLQKSGALTVIPQFYSDGGRRVNKYVMR